MAFCGYCGAEMPDDMSFCTECGKPLTRGKRVNTPVDDPIDDIGGTNDIPITEASDLEHNDAPQEFDSTSIGDEKSPANSNPTLTEGVTDSHNSFSYDRWTMSGGNDLTSSDNLYDSLKNTNNKKNKAEKKKFILPLVMTLLFLGITIVVVMIKFKPYEKWINSKEEAVAEAEEDALEAESEEEENDDIPLEPTAQPTVAKPDKETYKDPEIKDLVVCFQPFNQYSNYVYIDYFYEIYNPNTSSMITSMKLTLTLRNSSDAILGTSSANANIIMPGDTVYAFGTMQLTKSEASQIEYDDTQYEWDYATESRFYSPIRSSEIVVSNISARGTGYNTKVTGEITNNSDYDTSAFTQVYAIFRKGDEVVAIASTYVDPIYSGISRVFEINCFQDIPDYDTVQIFVDVW